MLREVNKFLQNQFTQTTSMRKGHAPPHKLKWHYDVEDDGSRLNYTMNTHP